MKRTALILALLAAIVAGGRTISVAEDSAQPGQPAGAAAPAPEGPKAMQNSNGCMPDGSCCGNGACAQAGGAAQNPTGGSAPGGCPCGKNKQAEKKPAEG